MTYPTTNDTIENLEESLQPVQTITETLTSGTAIQNPTSSWAFLCLEISAGASGTYKVDIGPTSACANNVFPIVASNAASAEALTVPLPPGWYVKVTVSVATIASAVLVTQ